MSSFQVFSSWEPSSEEAEDVSSSSSSDRLRFLPEELGGGGCEGPRCFRYLDLKSSTSLSSQLTFAEMGYLEAIVSDRSNYYSTKFKQQKNIEGLALKIVQKTYPLRSWPTGQKNSLCFPALFANIGQNIKCLYISCDTVFKME